MPNIEPACSSIMDILHNASLPHLYISSIDFSKYKIDEHTFEYLHFNFTIPDFLSNHSFSATCSDTTVHCRNIFATPASISLIEPLGWRDAYISSYHNAFFYYHHFCASGAFMVPQRICSSSGYCCSSSLLFLLLLGKIIPPLVCLLSCSTIPFQVSALLLLAHW